MWIHRIIQDILVPGGVTARFPVVLLVGPRQVGKSSVLRHLGAHRHYVTLDDLATRQRAVEDPVQFAKNLRFPVILDEIQYAPELLSAIKLHADSNVDVQDTWLTGSQSFEVMRGVRETLAGRVAILHLLGLSDEEKARRCATADAYFAQMLETTFPRLFGVESPQERELYLSSYVATYIERDVQELVGISKRREFEVFVRMCALRTGHIVNYDDLARDARISPGTAKQWLDLLEDSFLIKLVRPHHSNRSKRLIKSPKLYFLDMGLAAYLAGWRNAEQLRLGPMGGAALETHVLGSIVRWLSFRAQPFDITFWRTRDGQEIDFLVETGGRVFPVEVKLGSVDSRRLVRLETVREDRWMNGRVLSPNHLGEPAVSLTPEWWASSPMDLDFLKMPGA